MAARGGEGGGGCLRGGVRLGGTGWGRGRGGSPGYGPGRGGERAVVAVPFGGPGGLLRPPGAAGLASSDVGLQAPAASSLRRGAGEAERCFRGYLQPQRVLGSGLPRDS